MTPDRPMANRIPIRDLHHFAWRCKDAEEKPTHVERTIFGEGDGSDLAVHDSPLQPTAGRRTASLLMAETRSFQSTHAFSSRLHTSSCSASLRKCA